MESIELAKISRSSHFNETHMEKNTVLQEKNMFKNQKKWIELCFTLIEKSKK